MPTREELSIAVHRYIAFFNRRHELKPSDTFAPKAVRILLEFADELDEGNNPNLHEIVYPNIGYHAGFMGLNTWFDKINISDNDLTSYILMEKLIDSIKVSGVKTEMTDLFLRFSNEALTPAFEVYKTSKLTLDASHRSRLESTFDSLNACLNAHFPGRWEQIKLSATHQIQQLGQQFLRQGFSMSLITKALEATATVAKENADLAVVFSFLLQYESMLENETMNARDLMSLKSAASDAKAAFLRMPETKEVKQFHWLINAICNFINDYISELFESQARIDINRFFSEWDEVQVRGDRRLRDVESRIDTEKQLVARL